MHPELRQALRAYYHQIATVNGVENATELFNVEPSVQQRLESKMQEDSGFLSRINMVGVREMEGEKVGLGVSGPVASTTPNDGIAVRQPRSVHTLDARRYRCEKIDYDTFLLFSTLDVWAKFPDFQTRLAGLIVQRQALDRIMIGWNGTRHAAQSDLTANPLLQDVQKGWLQHYRDDAPERVFKDVKVGPDAGADYKNLDAVVYDAAGSLLDVWHQDRTDLVAICGRKLLQDKYFPLVNNEEKPTETLAGQIIQSQKRIGGLPAVRVPYFPDNAIFVTALSNLSIYWQTGARRRHLREEPERNRIVNFESSNDAYVVEDYGAGCLIEGITFTGDAGEPAPGGSEGAP